jgi:hypothetical protein
VVLFAAVHMSLPGIFLPCRLHQPMSEVGWENGLNADMPSWPNLDISWVEIPQRSSLSTALGLCYPFGRPYGSSE